MSSVCFPNCRALSLGFAVSAGRDPPPFRSCLCPSAEQGAPHPHPGEGARWAQSMSTGSLSDGEDPQEAEGLRMGSQGEFGTSNESTGEGSPCRSPSKGTAGGGRRKKKKVGKRSPPEGQEGKQVQRNAANARERARMRVLSKAFSRLKTTLPWVPPDTKLSKLDTLRLASSYIAHLRQILANDKYENGYIHPVNLTWPFMVAGKPETDLKELGSSGRLCGPTAS